MLNSDFNLMQTIEDAITFYHIFKNQSFMDDSGLKTNLTPKWAADLLKKQTIPQAIIKKVGSKLFAKTRPHNTDNFEKYVSKKLLQKEPLIFRGAIGPIKNVQLCSTNQKADLAEFMHYIQLARFAEALSCLYPFGIKVELIPDTIRAKQANQYPEELSINYIKSIQTLCQSLGFGKWLTITDGQKDLWQKHQTDSFIATAKQELEILKTNNPDTFSTMLQNALIKAEKNLISTHKNNWEQQIEQSAWNYITCLKAEQLSGMWSLEHIFPIVFANHPNNFQLRTLKSTGETKLPWQTSVPVTVDICQEFPLINSLFNVNSQTKQAA